MEVTKICGVVGSVVGNNWFAQMGTLESLYQNQKSRGREGFGMANGTRMSRLRGKEERDVLGWKAHDFISSFREGDTVLFHHRFPTSTKNTEKTAHPFITESGKMALIHNGVICNYKELYKELKANGHVFESEEEEGVVNDSEVILHQLEENIDAYKDIPTALAKLRDDLSGGFAIAFSFKGKREVHLFRHINPIVISEDEEGNQYFSSEHSKYFTETTRIHELADDEYGILSPSGYETVCTLDMLEPDIWKMVSSVDKGKTDDKHRSQWSLPPALPEADRFSVRMRKIAGYSMEALSDMLDDLNYNVIVSTCENDIITEMKRGILSDKALLKLSKFVNRWIEHFRPDLIKILEGEIEAFEVGLYEEIYEKDVIDSEVFKIDAGDDNWLEHKMSDYPTDDDDYSKGVDDLIEESEERALSDLFYGKGKGYYGG